MGLDGRDYGPAHDIHEEQGKREAKAHKDSEQNGGGWTGLSRLDACRHGVDRFVEDGSPDVAGERLYGVESERSAARVTIVLSQLGLRGVADGALRRQRMQRLR